MPSLKLVLTLARSFIQNKSPNQMLSLSILELPMQIQLFPSLSATLDLNTMLSPFLLLFCFHLSYSPSLVRDPVGFSLLTQQPPFRFPCSTNGRDTYIKATNQTSIHTRFFKTIFMLIT